MREEIQRVGGAPSWRSCMSEGEEGEKNQTAPPEVSWRPSWSFPGVKGEVGWNLQGRVD